MIMSHRNVEPHVSIDTVPCYRTERALMACADSPSKGSKGVGATPAVSSSEKNNDVDAVGRGVTGRVSHELAARAALQ